MLASGAAMQKLALLLGGAVGVFGLALILGAVAKGAGLGPPELVVGLLAIGLGAALVMATRR